jgi:hypothetical protein
MLLFCGGTLCIMIFAWIYLKYNINLQLYFVCFVISLIMLEMRKMQLGVVTAITLMVVV